MSALGLHSQIKKDLFKIKKLQFEKARKGEL